MQSPDRGFFIGMSGGHSGISQCRFHIQEAPLNLIDNDSYYDIVESNENTFSAGTNHDEK